MMIGDRLKELREAKNLSQGDIENRTHLLRCYISRVENGHTVPAVETLEKFARALEIPIYQLFYEGEEPPKLPLLTTDGSKEAWGATGPPSRYLSKLRQALAKMDPSDRTLLMHFVQKMCARRKRQNGQSLRPVDGSAISTAKRRDEAES